MKTIKNIGICALPLFFCFCFFSCKKEKERNDTIENDIAKKLSVYPYVPIDSVRVYFPQNIAVSVLADTVNSTGFPALLRKTVGNDIVVTAKIDTSIALMQAFDKLYQTTSQVFKQNQFKVANSGKVVVKAGQNQSADLFKIQFDNAVGLKPGHYVYWIPLRLSSGAADDVLESDIMVIRYTVNVIDVINIDHRNTGLTGNRIDRTAWRDTANSETNGAAAAALDGDNSTHWHPDDYQGLPHWLELDMGKVHTLKGFLIVPNSLRLGFDFIKMDVLSSNDGMIWKAEGRYNGTATNSSSSDSEPDIKTIKFITPVTARYFKFNVIMSTNRYSTSMAEIYGIE